MSRAIAWALATLAGFCCFAAEAHKESDGYLTLQVDAAQPHMLHGQWDVSLRDLVYVLDLDDNGDGQLTWAEVKAHRAQIEAYALPQLAIRGDGLACAVAARDQAVDEHSDGMYDVILFEVACDKDVPSTLTLSYTLFHDVDPYHRGIVTVLAGGQSFGAILAPERSQVTLDLRRPDRWQQFLSFARDGIWHIWTGPDHVLFILALLLPAALVPCTRRPRECLLRWAPGPGLGVSMLELLKVVSAFTLSHSATLTLSVLGYVHLPSRLVESGIALSIIVAAANNLVVLLPGRAWLIAFFFGFIHGLGFASALAGLQLPPTSMAAALGGFSLGVEMGQEAIVLPLVPLAFAVRRTRAYRLLAMRYGSLAIMAIAMLWLVQRAFEVSIPGTAFLSPP